MNGSTKASDISCIILLFPCNVNPLKKLDQHCEIEFKGKHCYVINTIS